MPSGRKALMEQLRKIIGSPKPHNEVNKENSNTQEDPIILFQQEALARFKPRLHQFETYKNKDGKQTIFAVVNGNLSHPNTQMQKMKEEIDPQNGLQLEILDRSTFEVIQRLCKAGILSFNHDQATIHHQSQMHILPKNDEEKKRLKAAQKYKELLERKERMASLLIEGEFYEEALFPLREVFEMSLKSFAALMGQTLDEKKNPSLDLDGIRQHFSDKKDFPKDAFQRAQRVQQESILKDKNEISDIANHIRSITQFLENEILSNAT